MYIDEVLFSIAKTSRSYNRGKCFYVEKGEKALSLRNSESLLHVNRTGETKLFVLSHRPRMASHSFSFLPHHNEAETSKNMDELIKHS